MKNKESRVINENYPNQRLKGSIDGKLGLLFWLKIGPTLVKKGILGIILSYSSNMRMNVTSSDFGKFSAKIKNL
jgi:hypothetical protein